MKGKNIFFTAIFSFLFLVLTASCSDGTGQNLSSAVLSGILSGKTEAFDLCCVSFRPAVKSDSVESSSTESRNIVPPDINLSSFKKFELTLTPLSGSGELKTYTYTSADEIVSQTYSLCKGKWKFSLDAYIEQDSALLKAASCSVEKELAVGQEYSIEIKLELDETGSGSYSVIVQYPKAGCSSVSAELKKLNGTVLVTVSGGVEITPQADSGANAVIKVFGSNLTAGYYYLVLSFLDLNGNVISKKIQFVDIKPFSTSTSPQVSYTELNTPYTVTYHINPYENENVSIWESSFTPVTTFNSSTKLDFTGYENHISHSGLIFKGWYMDSGFTEPLASGEQRFSKSIDLYARWTLESVYIDVLNGDDSNSGISAEKAVKTVATAAERIKLNESERTVFVCNKALSSGTDLNSLSLLSQEGVTATLYRYSSADPVNFALLEILSSNIEISNLIFDGGAIIDFTDETNLPESGKTSTAPLIKINSSVTGITLSNCVIQNNDYRSGTNTDGVQKSAVKIMGSAVLKNCTVKHNVSVGPDAGLYAGSGSNVTLDNTAIEGNYITTGDSISAGALVEANKLYLKGTVNIWNNYNVHESPVIRSNLNMKAYGSVFNIIGNIEGSEIYFYRSTYIHDPAGAVLTSDYSTYNTEEDPYSIFKIENNYILQLKDGEIAVVPSTGSATINTALGDEIIFSLSSSSVPRDGTTHTVTVKVSINGTLYDYPGNEFSTFGISKICYYDYELPSSIISGNQIELPDGYPAGNYFVHVSGTYKDIKTNAVLLLTVTE